MLTYFWPFAFTKMQQSLELNYSTCLKICSLRGSHAECLSSGFWLPFIFSFSKFFFSVSSIRRAFVWFKNDENPTDIGQLHLCVQILNPHRCRCEVWTTLREKSAFTLGLTWHLEQLPAPLHRLSLEAKIMCCYMWLMLLVPRLQ